MINTLRLLPGLFNYPVSGFFCPAIRYGFTLIKHNCQRSPLIRR